ncbi:leucine-rich repeat-containing protein 34 [Gigaspora margarita]|uniref:Leucine-rich repeat-containing protein 34 n=1 Tax=Gigaspora margarita TaxID=4874 RepID=A0A8H4AVE7_GIGMA|nr:leucine-rich repeat-containing protein 34 [Gigaspora margarita]
MNDIERNALLELFKNFAINSLLFSVSKIDIKTIATFSNNSSIKSLCFQSCGFGTEIWTYFSNQLVKNKSITLLDLSASNFYNFEIIFESFGINQMLTTLILNQIGFKSGESRDLIEGLDGNTNLKYLDLHNNKFTVEMVHSFISHLLNNATLTYLDLSFNLESEDIPPIQQYIKQEKYANVLRILCI